VTVQLRAAVFREMMPEDIVERRRKKPRRRKHKEATAGVVYGMGKLDLMIALTQPGCRAVQQELDFVTFREVSLTSDFCMISML
jgi:hypothetical protein